MEPIKCVLGLRFLILELAGASLTEHLNHIVFSSVDPATLFPPLPNIISRPGTEMGETVSDQGSGRLFSLGDYLQILPFSCMNTYLSTEIAFRGDCSLLTPSLNLPCGHYFMNEVLFVRKLTLGIRLHLPKAPHSSDSPCSVFYQAGTCSRWHCVMWLQSPRAVLITMGSMLCLNFPGQL